METPTPMTAIPAAGSNADIYTTIAADVIREEEEEPGVQRSDEQLHLNHQLQQQQLGTRVASSVVACNTETTVARICQQMGLQANALHLEAADGRLRRLDPFECPLAMQNAFLAALGYADSRRVQKIGPAIDLGYLLRFYSGRPVGCRTFARHSLSGVLEVWRRGGGLMARWEKRQCDCSSTAIAVYKGSDRLGGKSSLLLARGSVQALKSPKSGREHCLLVRGLGRRGEKELLLAFKDSQFMERWRNHIEKVPAASVLVWRFDYED